MDGKKIVVAAVCVIVILIAVAVLVSSQRADTTAPDDVMGLQYHIIDVESMEVSQITVDEWNRLKEDPATGYRTLDGSRIAMVVTCPHCGSPIPQPPFEEEPPYNCPRCGSEFDSPEPYRP